MNLFYPFLLYFHLIFRTTAEWSTGVQVGVETEAKASDTKGPEAKKRKAG